MKRSFKNPMSATLAVGLMGGAGLVVAGPASAAPSCHTATTASLTTYTAIWMPYIGSTPQCHRVQARMDRYVGGTTPVITRFGTPHGVVSEVAESIGTNAGNRVRHQMSAGGAWSAYRAA